MTNRQLIDKAASVVKVHRKGDFESGGVGCALLTESGKVYTGVCIDTIASMGYCAEHNAIGTMVTDGEFKITKIVAVWKDEQGKLFVIPPCGRCRELIHQTDPANLDTQVILDVDKTEPLRNLLPYHDWWKEME